MTDRPLQRILAPPARWLQSVRLKLGLEHDWYLLLVAAAIGLGYLRREGDAYVLNAELKNGMLEINGAPMTLPLFD